MANRKLLLGRLNDSGTITEVVLHICDTYAGRPVTGLNIGDIGVMLDASKILFADSATTWNGDIQADQITLQSLILSGSGGNYSLLSSSPSAPQLISLPDTGGTLVEVDFAQTLANKTLSMGGAGVTSLYSGTYTPTLTNVANLDSSTAYSAQYLRVGNTVTVSGVLTADSTLAATATKLGISLPIASNFGAGAGCAGVGGDPSNTIVVMVILGDATNNRAEMNWNSIGTFNQAIYYTYTYQVI